MMIIELNKDIIDSLTSTEKKIVQFINANSAKMASLSIVDIAEETFSSTSTVSRAIRKCGMEGFNELRYKISNQSQQKDSITSLNDIMNKSLVEVTNTMEMLSVNTIMKAANLLRKASKVIVIARGPSGQVAEEFGMKLQLMDFNCVVVTDPNIMINMSKNLKEGELIFVFSLNGKTPEIVETCQNVVSRGNDVIVSCCDSQSILLELSTINLLGYKHDHESITQFEVNSRLSLQVISRIIIDYLVYEEGKKR